jgi:putative hydrolase of the HAD superfamily
MAKIGAVLFDADGVIQRAPRDLHDRLTRLLGGAADAREACMADIFAAEAPALVGRADFALELAPIVARWRAACDAEAILTLWRTIEIDPSVLAVVADLRRAGVYCAIASSQERHRARYMSKQLGYGTLFDAEFYSCDLGCAKPDRRFFAEIVRRATLVPERTLFLDDRIEHVEAARACGLRAVQFVLGEIGSGGPPLRTVLAAFGLPTG